MARFIQAQYPTEHAGVTRVVRAAETLKQTVRSFDGARGAATMLLAAIVSALLVVANEVIDTWTEGHLMAAWIALWALGFAALALFARPAARLGSGLRSGLKAWSAARKQAAEDEKLWNIARTDARVMADLSRAMSAAAERDLKVYY
jgi:hypothetical protein